MGNRMALCLDEVSSQNPELIGLEGEAFEAQEWLGVFSTGTEARREIADNGDFAETWVVSCDDVEPINLAASLKSDMPDRRVCLVTADPCGSLFSRAHTAQIDEVLEFDSIPRRYAEMKRLLARVETTEESGDETGAQVESSTIAAPVLDEAVVLEKPVAAPLAIRVLDAKAQPRSVTTVSDSRAFVLTVVSGSGGAGKSSVSALGAVISQEMGHRTLLLDCDLQFGDVAGMVGSETPLCIDEAMAHPERLESDLADKNGLSVLAAPKRLETAEEVVRGLPGLLARLSDLFDVIVVNTGASWAEQHALLLERSSAALFLVDQRASSVRACRHALELCARCGIATGPFQFALNRCAKGSPLTSIDVSCVLQGAPVFELKDGGREVEDYLSGGAPHELLELKNEFAKSLAHVMDRLLPAGSKSLVERSAESDGSRLTLRRNRRTSKKRRKGQR